MIIELTDPIESQIERQIESKEIELSKTGKGLLRDEITPDDIADVVSIWSGIPIRQLVESY